MDSDCPASSVISSGGERVWSPVLHFPRYKWIVFMSHTPSLWDMCYLFIYLFIASTMFLLRRSDPQTCAHTRTFCVPRLAPCEPSGFHYVEHRIRSRLMWKRWTSDEQSESSESFARERPGACVHGYTETNAGTGDYIFFFFFFLMKTQTHFAFEKKKIQTSILGPLLCDSNASFKTAAVHAFFWPVSVSEAQKKSTRDH